MSSEMGTSKAAEMCWSCNEPIESCGKTGWLHVNGLDDHYDHEAHPVGKLSNDASKLPSAPSPAGETASAVKFECPWLCGDAVPHTHIRSGPFAPKEYAAVPEPVSTEKVACDCIHGNFCMAKQGTLIPGFYCRLTTGLKVAAPIAPAAVSDQRSKTMNHEFWCFSRTGGVCNCAATENAVVSSADLVDIGTLRRELFVNYDSPWNGWVRDTTASIETEAGVSRSQMIRKMAEYGAVLLHNIGFMRDIQGAPSAEGDGWIAPEEWVTDNGIQTLVSRYQHSPTLMAALGELQEWRKLRGKLPAPPSGQGEVK